MTFLLLLGVTLFIMDGGELFMILCVTHLFSLSVALLLRYLFTLHFGHSVCLGHLNQVALLLGLGVAFLLLFGSTLLARNVLNLCVMNSVAYILIFSATLLLVL